MTEIGSRLSAALADRYRIERELGQGGMATVFLAEDIKHDRKVALKVLRPELAAVLGAERFVQEIKTTANLQHPHILPLFDSGTADGFLYYVMPFIDGETLRNKLDRETQLGVGEAVRIATEVADALDYAHRQGVIHRDIKPENILLHDGRPMVADFGIALAVSAAAGGRMTETGLSLGTPHYMSPEQATAEKDITHKSDIYSLGAMLYEMLTGDPPHTGSSVQQIIMKIVTDEARPITELRRSVPRNVAAAAAKALEKLPADRFESAKEFAGALTDAAFTFAATGVSARDATPGRHRVGSLTMLGVAVVALLVGLIGGSFLKGSATDSIDDVTRASIVLDEGIALAGEANNAGRPIHTALALSPDGRTLVFAGRSADGVRQLYRRPLRGEMADPIDGTRGGVGPFFSPNGEEIGFWSDTDRGRLLRVPIEGGTPVEIAEVSQFAGASWGDNDQIVFRDGARGRLATVAASGNGSVTGLRSAPGAHLPHVLPGSRAVLYTVVDSLDQGWEARRTEVLNLDSGQRRLVLDNASDARYVSTGHLLFARVGTLMAIPFDPASLELQGSPTGVLNDVMQSMNGWNLDVWTDAAQYAISDAGHLAYLPGGITPTEQNRIAWIDRTGEVTRLGIEPDWYLVPRLSPNDDRLALGAAGNGNQGGVTVVDLNHGTAAQRIVSGGEPWVIWMPDGRDILFGWPGIVRGAADGSRAPETLVEAASIWAADITPDGREIIYMDVSSDPVTLGAVDLSSRERRTLLEEPSSILYPALSPDGRWLAYMTWPGGALVVRSYPGMENRTVIAASGQGQAAWSKGGREIAYVIWRDGRPYLGWTAFDPDNGRTFGDREEIPLPANYRSMGPVRGFDITDDGQRAVVILQELEVPPIPRRVEIALNWVTELPR